MSQLTIKTVVVHGATGLQGGSVARALSNAGYTVRAAVRDLAAPKAKELSALPNVELVPVDLTDVQKLTTIYTGADAVFACTAPSADETQQGKNMADAAKAAGVRLFVWSSGESIEKITKDNLKLRIPLFDTKADVSDYLATLAPDLPSVHIYLGGFMENFVRFPNQSKYIESEDKIELQNSGMRPDVSLGWVWVEKDLPAAMLIILSHPTEFIGQHIAVADIKASLADLAEILQHLSGHNVRGVVDDNYNAHIPVFRTLKEYWNGPYFSLYKGWPSPHPLLLKYGFTPAPFEGYARERLLPHLGL